ncbi:putative importin subunit beta-4 [Fulvia fulva]|uniref:Importin subunit beta-4 n=1 Tax=Passalora fulva TaxID=5499 RepID=A0A9Q8L5A4_PASFU|nr:putative importin subunit beta-4 [Fulvia fulva]KAK4635243.1 putative importin subunit beta-4 [Fulvia fulva]KAK4637396.1 putative importin subunit beta-4 [Fulvia fulva]UJO11074.1 putative importin subunit beta-4 [Fulvia fulva]WPV10260.1 putative importin subunit beta-4 [Fulvia fulva]WPV23485.1 putative importin subunit beta-4 [Fulvia fulva]
MDESEFVSLLSALLAPDTEKVKAATSQLNQKYYKSPQSVTALLQILINHPEASLRQLAGVEARKLVSKHWVQVPADQKPQLREQLLQSTINEEQQLPRHTKARVIAAIAKIDLEDGEWSELPGILQQAATSETARHREVGVYIIYTLLETMPDVFQENMGLMLTLFNRTIQDPESVEVRVNTMLALSELAMVLDTEEDTKSLKAFQSTIPHMVKVLQATIQEDDEEHTMQAFDVFNKLLSYESAFLNAHFGDLIQFFMQVSSKTEIDDEVRSQAISFLMQAVRYRKFKIQSLKVGEHMTKMCLQIATELDELPSDEDDISPARSALGLLDILSESLPPSQVAVPLLKAIGPYVQHNQPEYRRAGILALGMCVEGAPDFIATQLNEILPLVLSLLHDPATSVRSAALNGVSRLADDLAEDMGKEHAKLIPALIDNFDKAVQGMQQAQEGSDEHELNTHIVKASAVAVDSLIEGLDAEDAAQYVNQLVPRFSSLIEHPDHKVQMAAVSALGSVASAAESAFQPHFQQIMQSLSRYIEIKDSEEQLELRSMVIDSLGKIASAVGAEAFQPYVRPLMNASEEGLHLDHQRLKETSFILWSTLARVYEENFEPFLNGVVQSLFACLDQEETDGEVQLGEEASDLIGQEITIAGKKIKVAGAGGVNEGDIAEEDIVKALMETEDDDDDDWDDLGAVTAVAMEKEIAVEVLGDVLTHAKGKFLPYMEKTIATTLPLLEHIFEGVRKSAISTLWRAYACMWGLAEDNGMQKWQPGLPLKVQPTSDLQKLGDLVMKGTLALWEEEMDRATVTEVNRNLAATLKLCGPAVLAPSGNDSATPIEQATAALLLILQREHPCQKDEDDFDEPAPTDGESAEYDWLVVETALEVIGALGTVLGEQFAELFKIFEGPIMKFCSSQERFERSSAVGTLADCVEAMGPACTPYTSKIMQLLLKRLRDEDKEVKSNAAFGMGLLCLNSTDAKTILSNYNTILGLLEPLLQNQSNPDDTEARLLDNAAGCVSRMIKKAPSNVPLEDVLPRLVELLPLKEDFRENEPVFDMIIGRYQAQDQTIMNLSSQLLPILEKVIGPPEEQLSEETRNKLAQLVQHLRG